MRAPGVLVQARAVAPRLARDHARPPGHPSPRALRVGCLDDPGGDAAHTRQSGRAPLLRRGVPVLWRTGAAGLSPHLDASQAFEACDTADVMRGFDAAWRSFVGHCGSHVVSVSRGMKYHARCGRTGPHGRWWILDEAVLRRGVWASMQLRHVAYGDTVWEMTGIRTGGITAKPALGLALSAFESAANVAEEAFAPIRWVDDLLVCAASVCSACVAAWVDGVYGGRFESCENGTRWREWLDLEVTAAGPNVVVRVGSRARAWLQGHAPRPSRGVLPRYAGALAAPFSEVRGLLCSKLRRLQLFGCGLVESAFHATEWVHELVMCGYPPPLTRALIHSLPVCPEVLVARAAARQLTQMGGRRGDGRAGRREAHGHRGGREGPRDGARDPSRSAPAKQRRARSPSSSNSSSSGYRKYKEARAAVKEEERFRRQGLAMAAALERKFDALTAAVDSHHGSHVAPSAAPSGPRHTTATATPAFPSHPAEHNGYQRFGVPQFSYDTHGGAPATHPSVQEDLVRTLRAQGFTVVPPGFPPPPPGLGAQLQQQRQSAGPLPASCAAREPGQASHEDVVKEAVAAALAAVQSAGAPGPVLPEAGASPAAAAGQCLSKTQCHVLNEALYGALPTPLEASMDARSIEAALCAGMKKGTGARAATKFLERPIPARAQALIRVAQRL